MRELTIEELGFVAGGLTTTPKEKTWGEWVSSIASAIWDAISGGGSGGSSTTLPSISGSDLGQMQRDCLQAGGSFSFEMSSSSAGASLRVVDASGNEGYAKVTCEAPQE